MEKDRTWVFDYQKFIVDQKLAVDKLPTKLQKMIQIIENHLGDANRECSSEECQEIIGKLQFMANYVMDELFNYVESTAIEEPEVASEKEDEKPPKTDEEIIEELYKDGVRKVNRDTLERLGFANPLETRYVLIGRYCLVHLLLEEDWYIYMGSELLED